MSYISQAIGDCKQMMHVVLDDWKATMVIYYCLYCLYQMQASTTKETSLLQPLRPNQFSFIGGTNFQQAGLSRDQPPTTHLPNAHEQASRTPELTFSLHSPIVLLVQGLQRSKQCISPQQQEQRQCSRKVQKEDNNSPAAQKTQHSSSDQQNEMQQEKSWATHRVSQLIKKAESQKDDYLQLNIQQPNVYQGSIILNKNIEDYSTDRANLCGSQFMQFSKFSIMLRGIRKVKIYPLIIKKKSFKIKLTCEKEEYNMGVQLRRELYALPEHYIWFAKIINSRLMNMGHKVSASKNQLALHGKGIFNQGIILKRSKYRKNWEKRYTLINNQGLFSYKNPKESYSFWIPVAQIQELWTNFQFYESNLVVKLKHKGEKTEFAIPIVDYCMKEDANNWLFAFYRLLLEHKVHIKV